MRHIFKAFAHCNLYPLQSGRCCGLYIIKDFIFSDIVSTFKVTVYRRGRRHYYFLEWNVHLHCAFGVGSSSFRCQLEKGLFAVKSGIDLCLHEDTIVRCDSNFVTTFLTSLSSVTSELLRSPSENVQSL